jgi:hypothetical protein
MEFEFFLIQGSTVATDVEILYMCCICYSVLGVLHPSLALKKPRPEIMKEEGS